MTKKNINEIEEYIDTNVKWLSDFIINSNSLHKIEMDKLKEDVSDLRQDVIDLGRILIIKEKNND